MENTRYPPRVVAQTFDDGYENFCEYAWPELSRFGFPAMVYLLSGLIGEASGWFEGDGREAPKFMDRERILQLRKLGFILVPTVSVT
jgi:hypothetical protein